MEDNKINKITRKTNRQVWIILLIIKEDGEYEEVTNYCGHSASNMKCYSYVDECDKNECNENAFVVTLVRVRTILGILILGVWEQFYLKQNCQKGFGFTLVIYGMTLIDKMPTIIIGNNTPFELFNNKKPKMDINVMM